jgi:hypothetical protein
VNLCASAVAVQTTTEKLKNDMFTNFYEAVNSRRWAENEVLNVTKAGKHTQPGLVVHVA